MTRSLLSLGVTALSLFSSAAATYIEYSTVTGYFLQDDVSTDPNTFDYTATNFGLINQTYDTDAAFDPNGTRTQWERFENKVASLQAASHTVDYKVLYIGRHGEGYHNVAQTFYGTPAWNCYWAELDGNATIIWADAHITPNGAAQAQVANTFWASQIVNQKQSIPQSFYTSPLARCLETAQITWANLTQKAPTVKELFREGISQHTCDRRSNRTWIAENYPSYIIEPGFTEFDELWEGVAAETTAGELIRSHTVLDEVFNSDSNTYMSITTHSGEGASLLLALGHQPFSLGTGAVIPVLVMAQRLEDAPASSSVQDFAFAATCTVPPITSLATGGCVCPSGTLTAISSSTSPVSVSASVTTSSSSVAMTTSVVYTTQVVTVLSCAFTATDCPLSSQGVSTITSPLFTTTFPVNLVSSGASSTTGSSISSTPGSTVQSSLPTTNVAGPSSSAAATTSVTSANTAGKMGISLVMVGCALAAGLLL